MLPAVGGIDDGRRRTAFGHGLVVEAPELPPGDFRFGHEEVGDAHPLLGTFVGLAQRLVPGAAQKEFTARNGHHADGGVGAGNRLGEGFEMLYGGGGLIDFPGTGVHGALKLLVGVSRDVMAGVEMAAYAVEMEFFGILLIMEMGRYTVVADAFRIQVLVAFDAGRIINYLRGIVLLALGGPVNLVRILDGLGPEVLGAHPELDHVVAVEPVFLGGKMAGCAIRDHAAFVQVVGRLFPQPVGLIVVVAAHAVVAGGGMGVHLGKRQDQHGGQGESAQNYAPDEASFFHIPKCTKIQ